MEKRGGPPVTTSASHRVSLSERPLPVPFSPLLLLPFARWCAGPPPSLSENVMCIGIAVCTSPLFRRQAVGCIRASILLLCKAALGSACMLALAAARRLPALMSRPLSKAARVAAPAPPSSSSSPFPFVTTARDGTVQVAVHVKPG